MPRHTRNVGPGDPTGAPVARSGAPAKGPFAGAFGRRRMRRQIVVSGGLGMEKQSTPEAAAWWAGLDVYERGAVIGWLVANEPPREWQGTLVDYAHTEMPFAPVGDR